MGVYDMNNCKIIGKSMEDKNKEGWLYGVEVFKLNKTELEALLKGKCLCTSINCGEYRVFIELEDC